MIAIVTDSTICISRKEAKALTLHIVPQTYNIRGQVYTESYSGENGEFEALLRRYSASAKTAHANISSFQSTYSTLLARGFEILVITMSSRLSGVYSAASMAAKETGSDKIRIVDSLTTAAGLALIARETRQFERTGKTLEETAEFAEAVREKVGTVFSVENMDALRRSGRIGFVRQSVSTILNVRPVLTCQDGMVIAKGIERGQNALITKMLSMVPENAGHSILMDSANEKMTELLKNGMNRKGIRSENFKLGPVLSIHLGLGVFGVAWITE